MTIVINNNPPKVKFESLKAGQVFKDSSGNYSMKLEERMGYGFNSVVLVPGAAGLPRGAANLWITDESEEVTPVQFDVNISPL